MSETYVDPTNVVELPEPARTTDHVPFVDPTNVIELPEPGKPAPVKKKTTRKRAAKKPTQRTASATSDTTKEN